MAYYTQETPKEGRRKTGAGGTQRASAVFV